MEKAIKVNSSHIRPAFTTSSAYPESSAHLTERTKRIHYGSWSKWATRKSDMAKPKLPARRAVARSGSHTPKAQGREPGSSAPDQQRETAIVFEDTPEEDTSTTPGFPVVGIGASAGGLEAFTRLLQYLPIETGMAFVLIQHLAPQHASILASLLSRATTMPVIEVSHGTPVKPNHVYVIPPNTVMS